MNTTSNRKEWVKRHPVVQSTHSGLWGFHRVHDCVDLKRCVYKSKRSAEIARALLAKIGGVE